MSLIKVDVEKCTRDGICIEVCPLGLLTTDKDGRPEMLPAMAPFCIGCGHCVAVCPKAALDNRKSPVSKHTEIPAGYSPDAVQSALFLRSRRSIRSYKSDPVPREKMLELLDIARIAPSGHNTQGISYLIVEGPENMKRLLAIVIDWMKEAVKSSDPVAKYLNMPAIIQAYEKGKDMIFRNAPHLIVAHAPADLAPAPVSTALCLEYAELYAPVLGMGTCWAGIANRCAQNFPPFAQFLKIPENRTITGMLMAGYPKFKYHRLPPRNPLNATWLEP